MKFGDISHGAVLKVYYFNVLSKRRKIFIFTGICKKFNKKKKTFTLENKLGKEIVKVNFVFSSPYIIFLQRLLSYNFEKAGKGMVIKRKYRLTGLNDGLQIIQPKKNLDPYDYIYPAVVGLSERQRLRRKFRV